MNKLPLEFDIETKKVLKQLSHTNNKIGELKGLISTLENPIMLLNAITLGEAKDSSEIENIVTTYDELYKEIAESSINPASKEVIKYRSSIKKGFENLQHNGFISINNIIDIHKIIEPDKGDIRRLPGTKIINTFSGETVHEPPQSYDEIMNYLANLEKYINTESIDESYDPLIKMAIIHYQFETIHPFYDGNGRTGRLLNVLYLVMNNKINLPILYLSKYIINNKKEYYDLLSNCNKDIKYIEEFIIYMLKAVEETSEFTINFINKINQSYKTTCHQMSQKLPKIYRKEIVDSIYIEFYTKNIYFREFLQISRATATTYLKLLVKEGFLIEEKIGKEVIYKNIALFNLISDL
jgi:Fic family protein